MNAKRLFWTLLTLPTITLAAWINDPAPAFTLKTISGESASLSDYKGKVVFVHFWASWCSPCKEELPKLNELAAAYDADEFKLLAITPDKSQKNISRFLEKYLTTPLAMQILCDPSGSVATAYRNRAMPMTFVLDKHGVIRFVHMGFQKNDETRWRMEIDQLRHEGE